MADYATNLHDLGIDSSGVNDCSAILAGLASGHYLVPAGTYKVSVAVVLASGVLLDCAQGAVFKIVAPGSLDFSRARTPVADDDQQIFDTTGVDYANAAVTGLRYLTLRWFGAKGDGKEAWDATFTSGSTTVTVAAAAFSADMVGVRIELFGGGTSGGGDQISRTTTVASYVSPTQITVTDAPTWSYTGNGALTWGTRDDRAIIHALHAVHATRGGRVFVPTGLYLRGLTHTATVRSYTTLEGEAQDLSRIKRIRGGNSETLVTQADVRGLVVQNLTLDLNADGDFTTGIRIDGGVNVTVTRTSLVSPSTDLLAAPGGNSSWTLYGIYTAAGARDYKVTDCRLVGVQIKAAGNGENAVYENVFIERNTGYNSRNYGVSMVVRNDGVVHRCVYIRHNSFADCESGGIYFGSDHWTVTDVSIENVEIAHNTVRGPQSNESSPYIHVRLGKTSMNVQITENMLYGYGESSAAGIQLDPSDDTLYARNVEVSGNSIFDMNSYGLRLSCGDDLLVARNQLYTTRGIQLSNPVAGVLRAASVIDNDLDGGGVRNHGLIAMNVPRLTMTGGTVKDHDTGVTEGAVRFEVDAGRSCDYRLEGVDFVDTLGVQHYGLQDLYTYPGTLTRSVTDCDFRGCLSGPITGGNTNDGRGVWRHNRTSAAMDTEAPIRLYGTATWNPPSLAAGATQTTTITVVGAARGDVVLGSSFEADALGTTFRAEVTAANTVTVYHHNPTGAAVDVTNGRLRVVAEKRTRTVTVSWNPPSLPASQSQTLDLMVPGTLTTDTPTVEFAGNLLGTTLSASVVIPDWVRVTHANPTASAVDVDSARLQVRVPLPA